MRRKKQIERIKVYSINMIHEKHTYEVRCSILTKDVKEWSIYCIFSLNMTLYKIKIS